MDYTQMLLRIKLRKAIKCLTVFEFVWVFAGRLFQTDDRNINTMMTMTATMVRIY